MDLPFELLTAGYCTAKQHHALHKSEKKLIRFYATYGLWKHPERGYILFDTGYTRRYHVETSTFPSNLYNKVTKVFIEEEEEAVAVLGEKGIRPEEIKYIIVSHFHADHVGGLLDFPQATVVCTSEAYQYAIKKKGFNGVRQGYLFGLLPRGIGDNVQFIDFNTPVRTDPILGPLADPFSDGSILICALPGHARGQIGALFNSNDREVFLASDSAWLEESYQEYTLPHPIVRILCDSWKEFKSTLKKVHDYHRAHPDTIIVPCHSNKARLRYDSQGTKKIWT